jgi:hypothetical protein
MCVDNNHQQRTSKSCSLPFWLQAPLLLLLPLLLQLLLCWLAPACCVCVSASLLPH